LIPNAALAGGAFGGAWHKYTTDFFEGCVLRPMAVFDANLTPLLAGPTAVLDAL
jgi:hypothetical protein